METSLGFGAVLLSPLLKSLTCGETGIFSAQQVPIPRASDHECRGSSGGSGEEAAPVYMGGFVFLAYLRWICGNRGK